MTVGPDVNERFPIRESLAPPIIDRPVFECAEAVHVSGFMAHARVRVWANGVDLLAEDEPPFGFAKMQLARPVAVGEVLTATQEAGGQLSAPGPAVTVLPLDADRVRNTVPDVIEPLYECGRVVPVGNLTPSTWVHVDEDGVEIGRAAVAGGYEVVLTVPLRAGSDVSAMQVACEGTGHEVRGPNSPLALPPPLPAPVPVPAPAVDAASLIIGNDTVTLTGLLVGAGVEVFDSGALVSSGWLATAGANWFPLTQRLSGGPVTATQELCGNVSPSSPPETPSAKLRAPEVLGPICEGARFVAIRGSVVNATVVVLRNGSPMTHGGSGPADVVLHLGQGAVLSAGDVVTALQYMNGTISPPSAPVTVTSRLGEASVEILGGESFFRPGPHEDPIPGPVFPRGRGSGPAIRVQTCCEREVVAWVTGPEGRHLANLELDELYPGYFAATWPWTGDPGWPSPGNIPVGEYRINVRSDCQERDASVPFFVVFDPAVAGGAPRFSFDGTAIWFGTGANDVRALHYYLRCNDWRVFRIAIQAAAGHTVPHDAAVAVARAEEALFAYSLDYHTNDVLDLLMHYPDAQCADDAACLTALLRCVGIPAHPVTADAGLETGAAYWTFDTWVEFLAEHGGATEWRVLHPHEYPGMAPETRAVFGLRGVANKGFNDLVVMAGEHWDWADIDDGTADVAYGRNACDEPEQALTRAAWVDEVCEAGYWPQPHWECAGVRRHSLVPGNGVRFDGGELEFGGPLSGSVHLVNPFDDRHFGRLTVELVTSRLESKAFVQRVLHAVEAPIVLDPGEPVNLRFDFTLPPTLAPGEELFLRARLDERTALLRPVGVRTWLDAAMDMPSEWRQDEEGTVRVVITNRGPGDLRDVEVDVIAPYALVSERARPERIDVLRSGERREVEIKAMAVTKLPAGSLHVTFASANGGGVTLRHPFRVEPSPTPTDARPAAYEPQP